MGTWEEIIGHVHLTAEDRAHNRRAREKFGLSRNETREDRKKEFINYNPVILEHCIGLVEDLKSEPQGEISDFQRKLVLGGFVGVGYQLRTNTSYSELRGDALRTLYNETIQDIEELSTLMHVR